MKGIILAAGRGSRMASLTEGQPKCLVEFKGTTLLQRQIDALRGAGLADIGIVTGYRREMLTDRGLDEFHNPRWAETNMVSSLECAKDWLEAGPCVVSYSDIFYDSSAVSLLATATSDLAVAYDPNWRALWARRFGDPLIDAETFRMGSDGSLAEIGNKPKSIDEIQGQYMGLLRTTPRGWAEIVRVRRELPADLRDRMHMTGTLQRVIDAHVVRVDPVPYPGTWGEIDSERDLACLSE